MKPHASRRGGAMACRLLACASLGGAILAGASTVATAQIVKQAESAEEAADSGLRLGQPIATRYRVGATIIARGGTVRDIQSMVAVPLDCPEQQVEIIEEDVTPNVEHFEYRPTDVGVRQMLIGIPQLSPREEAHALATCEVTTSPVLPPEDLTALHAPKKVTPAIKRYLGRSPFIDVNHRKIKQAVKEALAADDHDEPDDDKAKDDEASETTAEVKPESQNESAALDDGAQPASSVIEPSENAAPSNDEAAPPDPIALGAEAVVADAAPAPTGPPSEDWTRIEKLYDYARKKVVYEEGDDQSSVQALAKGRGDCQAIAALFVAMCRTEKVPARMVWADGHQYAEFYLENAAGVGRWYPVESAGARAFGEMPTARVILQKGDNFQVPERPRDRLRYASDYTILLSKPGSQPKITYVREQL